MRLHILTGDPFGQKVIGNLVNSPSFCRSCGAACRRCRDTLPSFAEGITGITTLPQSLPDVVENPEQHLPQDAPKCDVLLAIGVHPDILTAIPRFAEMIGARAVIVPVEDREWCPPGLRESLMVKFRALGIESAFPKPFCELEPSGQPTIDQFIALYRIGRPLVQVKVEDERIQDATTLRSAPCGATWYVAQCIKGKHLQNVALEVSKAHHGYPCTASRSLDPELGDTIIHKAGYIVLNEVLGAVARSLEAGARFSLV